MNHYKSFALILCTLVITSCGGGGGGSDSPASSDATLSNLSVSAGAVSPVFQTGTTRYTLLVPNDVAASRMTPTVNQANATVTVNGVAVSSGAASAEIPLAVGDTLLTAVVTAEDGSTTQNYTVTISREAAVVSLELLDPTPGSDHRFGNQVVVLGNGNIVVSDPNDSSRFAGNGAVHLYSPFSSTPIASLFGDAGGDQLGSTSITALANSNYVIASQFDNENGIVDAGSVRLMNGSTGVQIGATLAGDVTSDQMGNRSITVLGNNNYVIASDLDSENGIAFAGTVRLVSGSTGVQIGATLAGDVTSDQMGLPGITALANNNYVVASESDDENGIVNAGSVRLVNGSTGVQIGATLAGDVTGDFLGSSGITALLNNNYVIASGNDDENGIQNAGSVRLVNGSTGVQVGTTLAGDVANDQLGFNSSFSGATALANNNYVIASDSDDENGIVNSGSVRLVNGTTGVQIGVTLAGDVTNDRLGSGGITGLSNNNYVIDSLQDNENGIVNAGSVRLVNGATGVQIGSTLAGDLANDFLGNRGITVLVNDNYVIASTSDDENGIANAGTVRLVNGSTGVQIGNTIAGAVSNDMTVIRVAKPVSGDHYVLALPRADKNGQVDAGMVQIVAP